MSMLIQLRHGHFSDGKETYMIWVTDTETEDTLCVNTSGNPLDTLPPKELVDGVHYHAAGCYQDGLELLAMGRCPILPDDAQELVLKPIHGPMMEAALGFMPPKALDSRWRYIRSFEDAQPIWTAEYQGSLNEDLDELQARSPDEIEGLTFHNIMLH